MQWGHDIPFWKPIGKPNTNFVTAFNFTSKMQKNWGSKMQEMRSL